MGTYLATGIVQDIIVYIRYQDITGGDIAKGLSEKLNIDCYNYSEDDKAYYWNIKPEMLKLTWQSFWMHNLRYMIIQKILICRMP